jgi:hypothetical protein
MATDFSRVRHDPMPDWSGVQLKQGGVLLDADANERVSILDRRLRALSSDVLGRATVSATTPDAFRITSVSGDLEIGLGAAASSGDERDGFSIRRELAREQVHRVRPRQMTAFVLPVDIYREQRAKIIRFVIALDKCDLLVIRGNADPIERIGKYHRRNTAERRYAVECKTGVAFFRAADKVERLSILRKCEIVIVIVRRWNDLEAFAAIQSAQPDTLHIACFVGISDLLTVG